MKHGLLILLLFYSIAVNANEKIDSLRLIQLESKYQILEDRFKEVKRDQLNYSIEKDIYKEVYSNNFERINLSITFVLGLFGILGFLGIRNINTIKKDYDIELQELKSLRLNFETKVAEINSFKEKYDKEIEKITNTNIDQSNKIQLLELKEKIKKKINDKEHNMALETSLVALEIAPNDISLLKDISIIYCRLGAYKDSIRMLKRVLEIDPENKVCISDLVEIYYFNNQIDAAKKLIEAHPDWVDNERKEQIMQYLNIINLYHNSSLEELIHSVKAQIDTHNLEDEKQRFSWNFDDIHHFHAHVKYPTKEKILIHYIWFLKGDINGQYALDAINNEINTQS